MPASSRPYAFVQQGWFSGTNRGLRSALDPVFGVESTLIDVHDYRRLGRGSLLNTPARNLASHVREYGRMARRDPKAFVARRLETTFMFEHRSALARDAIRASGAPFALQTMCVFNAKTSGVPLFLYLDYTVIAARRDGGYAEELTRRDRWIALERRAYEDAARIFTTSEFARRSVIDDYGIAPEQVEVVGTGVNVAVPDRPIDRSGTPRRIVFIGKQWERKGGPQLVEAFHRVRRNHPELELTIAGCTPTIADPAGITVLGRVEQVRAGELMREADVFAMPSLAEPSAIVYSEASAHALPILATAVGGTPERVLDGRTGLLSPPGDVTALAENLTRLLDEPGLATTLGQAGFRLVQDHFTWPAVARKIAAAIRLELGLESDAPGQPGPSSDASSAST